MVYPTELTLATGTTVYTGDPESDERIKSREVRVQVTYQIEDDEADVPLLASVKAAELERVHRAAWEGLGISLDTKEPDIHEEISGAGFDPAGLDGYDPGLEPLDGPFADSDPSPEEVDYLRARSGPSLNETCRKNGDHTRYGDSASPAACPAGTERVTGAFQVTEAETDWATRPQVLALGSHFTRLGLSHENQTALLRARFGKFRPERLTKDEAAGLMRSLERNEWEPAEPAALTHCQ